MDREVMIAFDFSTWTGVLGCVRVLLVGVYPGVFNFLFFLKNFHECPNAEYLSSNLPIYQRIFFNSSCNISSFLSGNLEPHTAPLTQLRIGARSAYIISFTSNPCSALPRGRGIAIRAT